MLAVRVDEADTQDDLGCCGHASKETGAAGEEVTTPEECRSLVAERVMGYASGSWFAEDDSWVIGQHEGLDECIEKDRWDPLESWADAGRVIERMEELGWDLSVSRYSAFHSYSVTFSRAIGAFPGATAMDLKEAISLAALRALGVEVE